MAQYKVPQDVEADDKLLGPFSFRQFVYLLIAGALIAIAVGLFQLFPLLAIIPLPPVVLFVALALPLKKDQPMETYLAALVSYYLKPRIRLWVAGQKESTIQITAPKIVEESRTRDISGEEATHRLSFLADIVDTGGYAIRGAGANPMREDLYAEANATTDMFETTHFDNLENTLAKDENLRHEAVMREMREAIDKNEQIGRNDGNGPAVRRGFDAAIPKGFGNKIEEKRAMMASPVVVAPSAVSVEKPVEKPENNSQIKAKPSIIELANNPDFSIATIAKEANRINRKDEGEVFISLH